LTCEPRAVGLAGTGSYVPPRVLTNFDLEKMVDTSDEWIRTRTGIRERRIADPEVATSDLGEAAARAALESAGVEPTDIDLLIVATVTPDTAFPSTASLLQRQLDIPKPTAFDLNVGCTGVIYGLAVAREMIATGAYERALVIGSETLSRITDWSDRSTCVLFGDGAGAAIVAPVAEGGILAYSLGNDGTNAEALKLRAGGSRMPTTPETVAERLHYLTMNGQEVFKFAVRALADSCEETVTRAGLSMSDIDVVIPHQANMRIIDAAVKRLNIPAERFICNLDRYGNTSAASIPIALDETVREGRIKTTCCSPASARDSPGAPW
jgi:3-oxoacyl-[acyl-carrier-protein] synthase-3